MDPRLLERYHSPAGAAAYRGKYRRSWIRRLSNRRELAVVRRALRRAQVRGGRLLDCPCGAGRLAPVLLDRAGHVDCADASAAMIEQAREALSSPAREGRVAFHVARAEDLPFPDASFDAVVCHRLVHHLSNAADRAQVFRELARVARGSVLISFSDDTTWKARSQRRRGVRRNRHVLSPEQLAAEVAPFGLVARGAPLRLAGLASLVAVQVFDVGSSA